MKARVTITGNLTKDAENFVSKTERKMCRFTVAVNYQKDAEPFFVDCFLNAHLSDDKLQLFTKGTLCTFVGRYNEELNEKDAKRYFRTGRRNNCKFVSWHLFFVAKQDKNRDAKQPLYSAKKIPLYHYKSITKYITI